MKTFDPASFKTTVLTSADCADVAVVNAGNPVRRNVLLNMPNLDSLRRSLSGFGWMRFCDVLEDGSVFLQFYSSIPANHCRLGGALQALQMASSNSRRKGYVPARTVVRLFKSYAVWAALLASPTHAEMRSLALTVLRAMPLTPDQLPTLRLMLPMLGDLGPESHDMVRLAIPALEWAIPRIPENPRFFCGAVESPYASFLSPAQIAEWHAFTDTPVD